MHKMADKLYQRLQQVPGDQPMGAVSAQAFNKLLSVCRALLSGASWVQGCSVDEQQGMCCMEGLDGLGAAEGT